MSAAYFVDRSESLSHHGIKGQKWGVRRKNYVAKGIYEHHPDGYNYNENRNGNTKAMSRYREGTDIANVQKTKSQVNKDKIKKAIAIGAAIAGTALAAYGVYKLHSYMKMNNKSLTDVGNDVARKMGESKASLERFKENVKNAKIQRSKAYEEGLKSYSVQKRRSQASDLLKFMEENSNNSKSANINNMAERWLKGENFYGEKGQATDSVDYFKSLMKRNGYVSTPQQTRSDVAKSSLDKVREIVNSTKSSSNSSSEPMSSYNERLKNVQSTLANMAAKNQSVIDGSSSVGRKALEKLLKRHGIRTKGLI